MKKLNFIITLSALAISSLSYANDGGKSVKNPAVPVAPRVFESSAPEIPLELKNIKARLALVPRAELVTDDHADIPEELGLVKARYALVPLAPLVMGNADDAAPEELVRNDSGIVAFRPAKTSHK